MQRPYVYSILSAIFVVVLCSCKNEEFKLENGDLIFQDPSQSSVQSSVENSIQDVTTSIAGYNFTHVGIVSIERGKIYVLEATPPAVKKTPLEEYLYPDGRDQQHPRSVVGRVIDSYQKLIPEALKYGKSLIGKEYDYAYTLKDDKYYCSEYIYEIFLNANAGEEVFPLNVMTFKSPDTNEITDGWIEYYKRLGVPVPEGESGINPGAMSLSNVVVIKHFYE